MAAHHIVELHLVGGAVDGDASVVDADADGGTVRHRHDGGAGLDDVGEEAPEGVGAVGVGGAAGDDEGGGVLAESGAAPRLDERGGTVHSITRVSSGELSKRPQYRVVTLAGRVTLCRRGHSAKTS